MKPVGLVPATLFALLVGCAATTSNTAPEAAPAQDSAEDKDKDPEETARKIEDLERKLDVARARLAIAKLEAESYEQQQKTRARHASAELDLAKAKLATFQEADAPNRIATEELSLRSAKDRAQEAKDELAQIEIMYKDQDLDDLTAEFVVSRGRRNAERAEARIAIQEGAFQALKEMELPQERKRHELEIDKAVAGLEQMEREGKIGMKNKALSVQEAQNEIERLERELVELQEESKS